MGHDKGGKFKVKGGTVQDTELLAVSDGIASVTTTTTPGTGTCAVQFVFKNTLGKAIAGVRSKVVWISDINGAPVAAVTSFAALINGNVDVIVAGKMYNVQTTAAGLLGLTVLGSAATRYITIRLANGKLLTSGPIVIN